eukprot:TRINITY_DN2261_c0_g1_i1.p1 TRINITY_DN2261_c0_g1~~TRINITY_DN2261_c0_g1_i1.p1  ORF type:complete len:886 (-),score=277.32 TRINITY_DN2261_c0_g1_i1:3-2660(-)
MAGEGKYKDGEMEEGQLEELKKLEDLFQMGFIEEGVYLERKAVLCPPAPNTEASSPPPPQTDLSNEDLAFSMYGNAGSSSSEEEGEEEEALDYTKYITVFDVGIPYNGFKNYFDILRSETEDQTNDLLTETDLTTLTIASDDETYENTYKVSLPYHKCRPTGLTTLDGEPIVSVEIFLKDAQSISIVAPKVPQFLSDFHVLFRVLSSNIRLQGTKKRIELVLGGICKVITDHQKYVFPLTSLQQEYLFRFQVLEELRLKTLASLELDGNIVIIGTRNQIKQATKLIKSYLSLLHSRTHNLSVGGDGDGEEEEPTETFSHGIFRTKWGQLKKQLQVTVKDSRSPTHFEFFGKQSDIDSAIRQLEQLCLSCYQVHQEVPGATQYLFLSLQEHFERLKGECEFFKVEKKEITVVGTKEQREKVIRLVQEIVASSPQITEVVHPLPSKKMAIALIGKGGSRLKELIQKTNCQVKINTDVQPCNAKLVGTEKQINSAIAWIKLKIREIELDVATPAKNALKVEKKEKEKKKELKVEVVEKEAQNESPKEEILGEFRVREEIPVPVAVPVIDMEQLKKEGKALQKANTSNQVINIVPPRKCWDQIQSIRTLTLPNQRCGPHFSFIEPFVVLPQYERAAEILREVLRTVRPFTVTLKKLNYFSMKGSCMLYLEPEFEPKDGIFSLLSAVLSVFPHCSDQLKNGKFVPHMSIARFKKESELLSAKTIIERSWQPVMFTVKELYLLSRVEGDPFEVKYVIPLGNDTTSPYFGPGSPESNMSDESQLGRTVLVAGLPAGTNTEELKKIMYEQGFNQIEAAEICLNPNGTLRDVGIVEFKNRKAANACVEQFVGPQRSYVLPMYLVVYPGVVRDCCSLEATKKYLHLYPWLKSKNH